MNEIVYSCKRLDMLHNAYVANVPHINDVVLLPISNGESFARFKVVARFINHTGKVQNGLVNDVYLIEVELF